MPVVDATPLHQLLAFQGDHLVVTGAIDDPRLRRLNRSSLSASSASNVAGCPSRFAIESVLERVPAPFSEADLGTAAHKVLELLYQLPREQRTTQAATEILNNLIQTHPDEVVFPEDPAQQGTWRAEVVARITGLWQIEDPREVHVVDTEMRFTGTTIGGVPGIGFIDRVDIDLDGQGDDVKIIDYKSGKVKDPYGDSDPHGEQLRIYSLAHAAVRGQLPRTAVVYYIRHGTTRTIDLSPRKLRRTEESFAQAWETINVSYRQGAYLANPTPLCSWCPLATVCPSAIAQGRNRRHSKQSSLDFEAITAAGEHLRLPVLVSLPTSKPPLEASVNGTLIRFGPLVEDKSWEERSAAAGDGAADLNPNSFAAGAAFGLVEQAIRKLEQAGMVVTPAAVDALASTFAEIVHRVQVEVTGKHTFQEGIHTRLRGALNQALFSFPVPFGADEAGWQEWQLRVTKRIAAITNAAYALWQKSRRTERFGERPWEALVGVKPPKDDDEPTPAAAATAPATQAEPAAEPGPAADAQAGPDSPAVDDYVVADEPAALPNAAPVTPAAEPGYDPGDDF